ncbi:MAG: lipase family protein [Gammaproteobacteria bacterium]
MDALGMVNALIGVVTVYFVLSLVVTAIVEWWQQIFAIRGKVLEESVKSLFFEQYPDPKSTVKLERTRSFFAHERIWSLAEKPDRPPSYIDERTMAEVVVEVATQIPETDSAEPPRLVALMAAPAQMRAALCGIQGQELKSILLDLFDAANGDTEAFMRGVQAWIHQVGQRATGWLRRRIMPVTFCFSVAIAIAANADTVRIFQMLTKDPKLAESVARQAEATIGGNTYEDLVCTDKDKPKTDAKAEVKADASKCKTLRYAKRQASDVAPLLGWEGDPLVLGLVPEDNRGWVIAGKVLGLLITTAALMLGAPFWFDALQKLVKVRSSLRPDGNSKTGADTPASEAPAPAADGSPAPSAPFGGAASRGAVTDPDALPFNPVATKLDLANALWLSRVSEAVYQPNVEGLLAKLGGTFEVTYAELDTTHGHTQFAILARTDVVVLAFRGTEQLAADWMTDLRCKPTPASQSSTVRVHTGFLEALDVQSAVDGTRLWGRLTRHLREALASGRPLWITGHSLGGALAALAAHRLAFEEKIRIAGLCTVGQPRCGDQAFCDALGSRLTGRYWRVVNHRDPVPRVPGTVPHGYAHAGTLLYADEFGRLLIDPAWWLRGLDMLALPQDKMEAAAIAKAAGEDHSEYTEILRRAVVAAGGR